MSNQDVLVCQNAGKTYEEAGRSLEVLKGVSFTLKAGDRVAIVGTSGSGKSTLLNLLGGLEKPSVGEVSVGGENLYTVSEKARSAIRNRQLGFVYQFHHLLPEFTALENVAIPQVLAGEPIKVAQEKAQRLLVQVGLEQRVDHKPAQLSGGERQRVAIARALVNEPACVLMDEPTGNLDRQTAEEIQNLMMDLNQRLNTAFIVVTHDLELASTMDRVLVLKDGQLQEQDR
jgi:lipoprotein-releasing system ATP-binding protein